MTTAFRNPGKGDFQRPWKRGWPRHASWPLKTIVIGNNVRSWMLFLVKKRGRERENEIVIQELVRESYIKMCMIAFHPNGTPPSSHQAIHNVAATSFKTWKDTLRRTKNPTRTKSLYEALVTGAHLLESLLDTVSYYSKSNDQIIVRRDDEFVFIIVIINFFLVFLRQSHGRVLERRCWYFSCWGVRINAHGDDNGKDNTNDFLL